MKIIFDISTAIDSGDIMFGSTYDGKFVGVVLNETHKYFLEVHSDLKKTPGKDIWGFTSKDEMDKCISRIRRGLFVNRNGKEINTKFVKSYNIYEPTVNQYYMCEVRYG